MRLTGKDGVATLLFVAIIVPYIGYLAWGSVPFIQDNTGMAGLALILGVVAAVVGRWIALGEGTVVRYLTAGIGIVSLGLGILALVGENVFNDVTVWNSVLAGFIGTIAVLWAFAIARHAGLISGETKFPAGTTTA